MKGEKFMAISYTYPRVDVNTTALTRRILNETFDDTIVMLSIFNAKCGPVNTINRIHGINQFESIYGPLDDEVFGCTGLNIKNWLSSGGTVYALRHIPTQASANLYYGTTDDIGNSDIITGKYAFANVSEQVPGNTRTVAIFRKALKYYGGEYVESDDGTCTSVSYVKDENDEYTYIQPGISYKDAAALFDITDDENKNVHMGLYILDYEDIATGDRNKKYFPVYFPAIRETAYAYSSDLYRPISYNLYEFEEYTDVNGKTINILNVATTLPKTISELSTGSPSLIDVNDDANDIKVCMWKDRYITDNGQEVFLSAVYQAASNNRDHLYKLYQDENGNYLVENSVESLSEASQYFKNYFNNDTLNKLNLDHIVLPTWEVVIVDGEDFDDVELSDLLFGYRTDNNIVNDDNQCNRFVRYQNKAYEVESENFSKDWAWALNDKEFGTLSEPHYKFYNKSLQDKKYFKDILIGAAGAIPNKIAYREFILKDHIVNGYKISLEAVSFQYGLLSDNIMSLTKGHSVKYGSESVPIIGFKRINGEYDDIIGSTLIDYKYIETVPNDLYRTASYVKEYSIEIGVEYNSRIVSKNPGSLYNDLKISFYKKSDSSTIYKLFLGSILIESYEISGYADIISKDNAISNYIYLDLDTLDDDDVWNKYYISVHNALLAMKKNQKIIEVDLYYRNPRWNHTETISATSLEQQLNNKLIERSPLENGEQLTLNLDGGTDTVIVPRENTTTQIENSLQSITVFSALNTDSIRNLLKNTLEFPIDIVLDAGYSLKTKQALYKAFCSEPTSDDLIRSDVNLILDSFFIDGLYSSVPKRAIYSISTDYIPNSINVEDGFPKTNNTKNLSVYEQYFTINHLNKNTYVSPTYFLSKNIAYYDIELGYGTHTPIAGMKRGLIDGYRTINKQYLPGDTDDLFSADVNYATVFRNGTAFMSQRTREEDSQNTALQFFNNSFTTNRIVKELERIARAYLFEYNDAISISNLRKSLNQYIGKYITNRVLTYAMLDVQKDDLNPEQINIALNIKFNNSIEVIEVNLVIE